MQNYKTTREAVIAWVDTLNQIPTEMLQIVIDSDPNDWEEETLPTTGSIVWYKNKEYEVIDADTDSCTIKLDSRENLVLSNREVKLAVDSLLPRSNAMWSFDDPVDTESALGEGAFSMSQLGFRVYRSEKFGYFFGIDGGGYDYYAKHWTPLYKMLGMRWSDEDEAAAAMTSF